MAAVAVAGLATFVTRERHAASPMLPLAVFRARQFAATNTVTFIVYAALVGATFLLPVELQVVWGYSPLASGAALLPLTAIMLELSARSGRLASQIGPRLQMSVGPVVTGAGFALLTIAAHGSSYVIDVLPAVTVFGLGLAITVAPLTVLSPVRRCCWTPMTRGPSSRSTISTTWHLGGWAVSCPRCGSRRRGSVRPPVRPSAGRPAGTEGHQGAGVSWFHLCTDQRQSCGIPKPRGRVAVIPCTMP
jgi:hypothetical protein